MVVVGIDMAITRFRFNDWIATRTCDFSRADIKKISLISSDPK